MFQAGENIFAGDLTVTGAQIGRLSARLTFTQKSLTDPVTVSFAPAADGRPASYGFAEYDGQRVEVKNMLE